MPGLGKRVHLETVYAAILEFFSPIVYSFAHIMKVLKFGGSSVQDGASIGHVISLVQGEARGEGGTLCVVFSAMKGITDDLIKAARRAEQGRADFRDIIARIQGRQIKAVDELFPKAKKEEALSPLLGLCQEVLDILHGIELVRECSSRSLDLVMSFGERLNCQLIASAMLGRGMRAAYHDARSLIVTDDHYGTARVNFRASCGKITRRLAKAKGIAVVTGFIAASAEGVTTTLGRNGSDYTASLLAAALGADCLEIWKDVDGVLSANPSVVKDAFVIPELSYEEAM